MLRKKDHEIKLEVFDASVASALLLGAVAVFCMLLTANAIIDFGICSRLMEQSRLPSDVWANVTIFGIAIAGLLLLDTQSLLEMFGIRRCSSKRPPNVIVTIFGLSGYDWAIGVAMVAVNWLVLHGLVFSGLKLVLEQPLDTTPMRLGSETLHDLISGDLLLNPLIRKCTWESVYGTTCGHYLSMLFALSVANRSGFDAWRLAPRAICFYGGLCFFMAISGLFRSQHYTDGLWMVLVHIITVGLAYSQWHMVHSPSEKPAQPDAVGRSCSNILSTFRDEYQALGLMIVFVLTAAFGYVFAYFSRTIYPIHLIFIYALYIKSHKREWAITHQVVHCLVHHYRTLNDLPLLWIDKFAHILFAVVTLAQLCGKKELLSGDPLIQVARYSASFFYAGDVEALVRDGFYGTRRKQRRLWGWYRSHIGLMLLELSSTTQRR